MHCSYYIISSCLLFKKWQWFNCIYSTGPWLLSFHTNTSSTFVDFSEYIWSSSYIFSIFLFQISKGNQFKWFIFLFLAWDVSLNLIRFQPFKYINCLLYHKFVFTWYHLFRFKPILCFNLILGTQWFFYFKTKVACTYRDTNKARIGFTERKI